MGSCDWFVVWRPGYAFFEAYQNLNNHFHKERNEQNKEKKEKESPQYESHES